MKNEIESFHAFDDNPLKDISKYTLWVNRYLTEMWADEHSEILFCTSQVFAGLPYINSRFHDFYL